MQRALEQCRGHLAELLPEALCRKFGLPGLYEALCYVHAPPAGSDTDALVDGSHPARRRLALEELLAHHLALRRLRERRQDRSAPRFSASDELRQKLIRSLPFRLTGAQLRTLEEVTADLRRGIPALRLIQGDVGSGKTVVAAAAACVAVESKLQVAIMAPTELLAEQHLQSFDAWFAPLGVTVAFLGGRQKARERRTALQRIAQGESAIAIGTHALFQEAVSFAKLGLIVVDEQHRFGVGQRLALRDKGAAAGGVPHQLIMTATPIPRSLAMTFYADLDVSSIDELPPGRKPVHTLVLPAARRDEVVARVRAACAAGNQAYWVCPIIEESEVIEAQAATDTFEALQKALPELNVGLAHGRLGSADKEDVMERFRNGEVQLLVATTVIEVGVDVANAGLMIIENAERLGLSQLHQLRGRVGRGNAQAWCLLLYQAPLGQVAKRRLAVLRQTNDGFVIAREDMQQRGPGEVLGTRQTGLQSMRVADILRDSALVPEVERAGRYLRERRPELIEPLIRRWVRDRECYGDV